MKTKIFVLSIFSLLTMASCKTKSVATAPDRSTIKATVKDDETVLVDVRTPEEFKAGTAHNAVNIPLAEIENNLDFFKEKKRVVVFCNRGRQANQAIEILNKNGIENVENGVTWKNVKAIQEEK